MKRGYLAAGLLALVMMAAGGCASNTTSEGVERPEATYSGLLQQKCAILIWADWTVRTEYNQIQLDLARLVQQRLEVEVKPEKEDKKSPAPATVFINPASVVRYQREHPDTNTLPITEVAPRLGASRVIYVELASFSAQSPESIMILKGTATATLRVLEVTGGQAKVVFEESGITANYPPHAPEGVVPSDKVNVQVIYEGTLSLLADKLAARFKESK